jgi:NhaA family Na+:H+ antiporter
VVRPAQEFMRWEAASGVVLLVATLAALVWANAAIGSYDDVSGAGVRFQVGGVELQDDVRHLVNDGLMALFFLVIGLEIKRELVLGELSDRRAATLPVVAAVGGMALPALIFLAVTGAAGGEGARGWGIPMATDIAFALGVLALLGRRVPSTLAVLLLAVAVIDDIGAIAVIALFYSEGTSIGWLAVAGLGLAAIVALQRLHVRNLVPYVALGLAVWLATYESGVHATIAGVALGLLTPARPFQPPAAVSDEAHRIADETADEPLDPDADASAWRRLSVLSREAISPLTRIEHALHPWTSFLVLPVFALANAGIVLSGDSLAAARESPVTLGVAAGLVIGKVVGVTGGAYAATRLGLGRLPDGLGWRHVVGMAGLAGVGFTVSLFISGLAYEEDALASAAKIGILGGSVIAALVGAGILLASRRWGLPQGGGGPASGRPEQ